MDVISVVLVLAVVLLGAGAFIVWQRRKKPGEEWVETLSLSSAEVAPELQQMREQFKAKRETDQESFLKGQTMGALEIIEGPDAIVGGQKIGNRVEIYQKKLTIGRNPRQVDVQLYNLDEPSSVSRLHCTIEFYNAGKWFMITDEGSSSGTKVGGVMLTPHQPTALQNGDVIELGIIERMGAGMRFHTTFNPPDSSEIQGGRLHVDIGMEVKDTIKHSINDVQSAPSDQSDVFVSYSRRDRDNMRYIRESLIASGFKVWSDENLEPGSVSWRLHVEKAIEKAGCMVAILSPDAKQSEWVNEEISYAKMHKVRVFPVLVRGEESDAVPLGLTEAHWIDMRSDYETALELILKALREHLHRN
jgi:pSer/pThr/pTyr-binding forkhead associated (FHA) protein